MYNYYSIQINATSVGLSLYIWKDFLLRISCSENGSLYREVTLLPKNPNQFLRFHITPVSFLFSLHISLQLRTQVNLFNNSALQKTVQKYNKMTSTMTNVFCWDSIFYSGLQMFVPTQHKSWKLIIYINVLTPSWQNP